MNMVLTSRDQSALNALAINAETQYLRNVIDAVKTDKLALVYLEPWTGQLDLSKISGRPWLAIIGDDEGPSRGPKSFNSTTLKEILRGSRAICIDTSEPNPAIYFGFTLTAMLSAGQAGATIIECQPSHRTCWENFTNEFAPDSGVLIKMPEASCLSS